MNPKHTYACSQHVYAYLSHAYACSSMHTHYCFKKPCKENFDKTYDRANPISLKENPCSFSLNIIKRPHGPFPKTHRIYSKKKKKNDSKNWLKGVVKIKDLKALLFDLRVQPWLSHFLRFYIYFIVLIISCVAQVYHFLITNMLSGEQTQFLCVV